MYRLIIIKIVGALFLFTGIYFWKIYSKKFFLFFILTGLFISYIAFFGDISKSEQHIVALKNIDANIVQEIKISPTRMRTYEGVSLVNDDIVVNNKTYLQKICLSLKKVNSTGDEFLKNPQKVCRIEIYLKNGKKICFGLKKVNNTFCISLNSRGETGWHYGNLQADFFGILIMDLISSSPS